MYNIVYDIKIPTKALYNKFVEGNKIRILDHIIDKNSNAVCLGVDTINELCSSLQKYKDVEILKLNKITNL